MDKIAFHIATEFHYLLAHCIIEQFFNSSKGLQFVFFVKKTDNIFRLNVLEGNKSYKTRIINYSDPIDVKYFIKYIKDNPPSEFITFINKDPIFIHLSYTIGKRNTTMSVAPDGMAAFVEFKRLPYRSDLKNSIENYVFYLKHNIAQFKSIWLKSGFARNGNIDVAYHFQESLPNNISGIKVKKINYKLSPSLLERIKRLYNPSTLQYSKNLILLISSGNSNTVIHELTLISIFKRLYPSYKIMYKSKMGYVPDAVKKKQSEDFIIINKHYPAEIIIAELENSIIISEYSTSMLYHNSSCRYYWFYPYLQKINAITTIKVFTNPTSHIELIYDINAVD